MVINYNQFENAINNNKQSETLNETALAVLSNYQDHSWLGIYSACQYLFHFNSETGEYDKIIIEGLENALMSGLNIRSNPDKFLDASKTQARLYFKYNLYRKASSSLFFLTENVDPSDLPDWVLNYSAKVDIHTEIDYYLLEPDKLLKKIPLIDPNDRQRVSIYKEFLRVAYNHYINNGKEAAASFMRRVTPNIEGTLELFSDEWQALKRLIEKVEPEKLTLTDIGELVSANNALQEDNDELRQMVAELEAEIEEQQNINQKLHLEQQKLTEDYKHNLEVVKKRDYEDEKTEEFVPRILVLGASEVKVSDIYKIAKKLGLPREKIDIRNDYNKNKRFKIKDLYENSKYRGILIGPIAHNICEMGDYSSVIQTLKQEGYPTIEELRTISGKLKITNASFKVAMTNLLIKINSTIPS